MGPKGIDLGARGGHGRLSATCSSGTASEARCQSPWPAADPSASVQFALGEGDGLAPPHHPNRHPLRRPGKAGRKKLVFISSVGATLVIPDVTSASHGHALVKHPRRGTRPGSGAWGWPWCRRSHQTRFRRIVATELTDSIWKPSVREPLRATLRRLKACE